MIKRIIVLVLSLLLVLSLCGCQFLPSVDDAKTMLEDAQQALEQETAGSVQQADGVQKEESAQKTEALTEAGALEIAKELVKRYCTYGNKGIACDLHYDENMPKATYNAINNMLTEDQKMYLGGTPEKSLCCKTYKEAVAHTKKCIDSSLLVYTTKDYVEYKGNVYFFMGSVGITNYVNVSVKSYNNDKIVARSDELNSGDQYCGTYEFTLEKAGEDFKLMKVKSLGEIK